MTAPLVSIIIRNMDRQGLAVALQSVAAQSYANIEVIVVDASGQSMQMPAQIEWRPGHIIRHVSSGRRLRHPQVANAGINAASGDFFCFLDDNTSYEPHHVEALVNAAGLNPDALLLYARGRASANGDTSEKVFGRLFNRALFFFDPLFYLQAALINRRVIELGCRFDETLEVGDDHDFLKQIALHGDFIFLPNTPPVFNFLSDGGAPVTNANDAPSIAQKAYSENLKLAKWTGERLYHTLRSSLICARATELLRDGKNAQARLAFEKILNSYPDDPDALFGMAQCDLAAGNPESASRHILGAIDLNPHNIAYHEIAATIRQRITEHRGEPHPAMAALPALAKKPVLSFLPSALASSIPNIITNITTMPTASARTSLCGCGSQLRYKHCCGNLVDALYADSRVSSKLAALLDDSTVQRAQKLMRSGEAEQAATLLTLIYPAYVTSFRVAKTAGDAFLEMYLLPRALAMLERAVDLSGGSELALAAYNECCEQILRPTAWRSASRTLQALYNRLNARAASRPAATTAHLHIVCKLDTIGGTERRALNLFRCLSAQVPVSLWSTTAPLALYSGEAPIRRISADDVPSGGTLVLIGTYFDCGEWLEKSLFDTVVICHNLSEQYPSLMERMIQLEENSSHPAVKLSFPSRLFRDTVGLPGLVEYSTLDLEVFQRRCAPVIDDTGGRLTVGRHGRAYALKFHPNDPAFFRRLVARGNTVRLLGGSVIAAAFVDDVVAPVELLEMGSESASEFLESLDVFIFRKHPKLFETGGSTIIEAMAMALPVIVFREQCGVAELIEHGHNGFLVETEDEAIAVLDLLARDAASRERIGRAARATIVELMHSQQSLVNEFYLGISASEADLMQLPLVLE